MKVGFIGLGNVGVKLACSLLRNGFAVSVRDLDPGLAEPFLEQGAIWADSPAEIRGQYADFSVRLREARRKYAS
jgi:3-hydroxyisobutyrate dehydrogenase